MGRGENKEGNEMRKEGGKKHEKYEKAERRRIRKKQKV